MYYWHSCVVTHSSLIDLLIAVRRNPPDRYTTSSQNNVYWRSIHNPLHNHNYQNHEHLINVWIAWHIAFEHNSLDNYYILLYIVHSMLSVWYPHNNLWLFLTILVSHQYSSALIATPLQNSITIPLIRCHVLNNLLYLSTCWWCPPLLTVVDVSLLEWGRCASGYLAWSSCRPRGISWLEFCFWQGGYYWLCKKSLRLDALQQDREDCLVNKTSIFQRDPWCTMAMMLICQRIYDGHSICGRKALWVMVLQCSLTERSNRNGSHTPSL